MILEKYINSKSGAQSELSRAVGTQPQTMYQWVRGIRPIPIHHCVAIERVTGGQVTRQELRPDDWWKIWPELAQMQGAGSRPLRSDGSDADSTVCGGSDGDMSKED